MVGIMTPITFSLMGRIPSKKNSKQIITMGGRPMIISSAKHKDWEKKARASLLLQMFDMDRSEFPVERCEVFIDFIFPDRRATDLTNKAESVMDALVLAGVLKDDNCSVVNKVVLRFSGVNKDSAGALVGIFIGKGRSNDGQK